MDDKLSNTVRECLGVVEHQLRIVAARRARQEAYLRSLTTPPRVPLTRVAAQSRWREQT